VRAATVTSSHHAVQDGNSLPPAASSRDVPRWAAGSGAPGALSRSHQRAVHERAAPAAQTCGGRAS
ncbi:hypothetical protein JQK87_36895, partial [Streptomyces sp. G44]|nr:hypothetical protein [Streptomyces sp. G44]